MYRNFAKSNYLNKKAQVPRDLGGFLHIKEENLYMYNVPRTDPKLLCFTVAIMERFNLYYKCMSCVFPDNVSCNRIGYQDGFKILLYIIVWAGAVGGCGVSFNGVYYHKYYIDYVIIQDDYDSSDDCNDAADEEPHLLEMEMGSSEDEDDVRIHHVLY